MDNEDEEGRGTCMPTAHLTKQMLHVGRDGDGDDGGYGVCLKGSLNFLVWFLII